jgi:hypothetical protein
MDLEIRKVSGQGDVNQEYVNILAKKDCNLQGYMVMDETFSSDGSPSNKHRHVFIFPNYQVKKGDRIFLRTEVGKDTKCTTVDGNPGHRFHWGLKSPVWNEGGDKVHLLKIQDASHFMVTSIV